MDMVEPNKYLLWIIKHQELEKSILLSKGVVMIVSRNKHEV